MKKHVLSLGEMGNKKTCKVDVTAQLVYNMVRCK
jgi:hypothetical protein